LLVQEVTGRRHCSIVSTIGDKNEKMSVVSTIVNWKETLFHSLYKR